jgi:hypothetical protein
VIGRAAQVRVRRRPTCRLDRKNSPPAALGVASPERAIFSRRLEKRRRMTPHVTFINGGNSPLFGDIEQSACSKSVAIWPHVGG